MNCEWIKTEHGLRCKKCGFKTKTKLPPEKVRKRCPGKLPGPLKKVASFLPAVAKHVAAGSPKATQEQIDARLKVCQTSAPDGSGGFCEYYTGSSCLACGCACNANQTFMNKLYHADQECPVGKWGKVDGV